jgi:hypothetical protein
LIRGRASQARSFAILSSQLRRCLLVGSFHSLCLLLSLKPLALFQGRSLKRFLFLCSPAGKMGGDGGSVTQRSEMVKTKKKVGKEVDPASEAMNVYTRCSMT